MSPFIDLHCHSTASDGSLPPAGVVQLAREAGISALALTDHDTVAGIPEARAEAARVGLDFISGIEISCTYPAPGVMHLLGYGVDETCPLLAKLTGELEEARNQRNPLMIKRLNELHVAVSMEEWQKEAGGAVVGRPHLARILVRKGYCSSIKGAFNKYLGQGAAAYVDKEKLAPARAIEMIRAAGGIAVLAHPVQLHVSNDAQLETTVKNLVDMGLRGLETMHSDHGGNLMEKYADLAQRLGLLQTGGSDFHGDVKQTIKLGRCRRKRVPREFYEKLVAEWKKY